MNNKKKTYGVYGIMELNAAIPCGKAKMNFQFTGGSETAYGVVPATFTTEDPLKQSIIERSDDFKRGKIKLVSETDGTGKYAVNVVPTPVNVGSHLPGAATASAIMGTSLDPDGSSNKQDDDQPEDAQSDSGLTEIDVADIDLARAYLVENFGVTMSSLRYKGNVIKFAEDHKIRFVTPEGPLC